MRFTYITEQSRCVASSSAARNNAEATPNRRYPLSTFTEHRRALVLSSRTSIKAAPIAVPVVLASAAMNLGQSSRRASKSAQANEVNLLQPSSSSPATVLMLYMDLSVTYSNHTCH